MRISSYSFISILLKLHRCFVHGLKICMWFGYNPQIIFYHFFCKLNLVIFQALLLSTYVDSMYLVRVTPPMNLSFSDNSLFLKKILGGGHKFSEFACCSVYLHFLVLWDCRIHNLFESRVALNSGLGSVRDFVSCHYLP